MSCLDWLRLAAVGLASVLAVAPARAGEVPGEDVSWPIAEAIRVRLEPASLERRLEVGGETLHATEALPLLYEKRFYKPVWVGPRRPLVYADQWLEILRRAASEGLRGSDYHLALLERLRARATVSAAPDPELFAEFDLVASDAFLIYGAHLVSGRVDPETFDPEWIAVRREADLVALLEEAVAGRRLRETLDELLPRHPGYARLRSALARYRQVVADGGWETIPGEPALRPGDEDPRVAALRRRLLSSGDLPALPASGETEPPAELYDEDLAAAVRRFQQRHGLDEDGVLGRKSFAALNVSAAARVRQVELNLERWRWLPRQLGERYVLVNIPEHVLRLVRRDSGEEETVELEMRVVVGQQYRRTPVMSDVMRYLVLHPSWEVPHKLAVEDKLPEVKRDPTYFTRLGFRVFSGWGSEAREIDPASVDWQSLGAREFPYRLRQEPGPLNALGKIKFMFPNRFNVYLHDTPTREAFRHSERALSSGCIRLERPLDLAAALLAPEQSLEDLEKALADGRERTVPLPRPVPVHLQYWTAWAEADGTAHFRADIYGRDARLEAALAAVSEREETVENEKP